MTKITETRDWQTFRSDLRTVVGEQNCILDPSEAAPYCRDWRGLYEGSTPAVVRPGCTDEVASIVRLCSEHRVPIVPQGGNTGLAAGAVPRASGNEIVLSLGRMNRIRNCDPMNLTLTVEAGVPLQAAQQAALTADCLLPLSMGSEGSAQIGGVLSTNAGGNNTVRYGNARDLVLGLEVVLPNGEVWNGLRRLRKDNTGYCLRQLFVGAEGTLGVITAATLKLVSRPRNVELAFCAVSNESAAMEVFGLFRKQLGDLIQAFEYLCDDGLKLVLRHIPGTGSPLQEASPHYLLVEIGTTSERFDLRSELENLLEQAVESGAIQDGVVATSTTERSSLWRLREEQSEAQKREGPSIKNDVSIPVSRISEFLVEARAACEKHFPGIRVIPYGHVGDGNIHFNLLSSPGAESEFLKRTDEIAGVVNQIVRRFDGSFSAEHGIGQIRTGMMEEWRGGVELDTMRRIKAALDPLGIMNPGKVLPGRGDQCR